MVDPMTIGMLVGAGSSLLSGFMQNRANKRAARMMDRFRPEEVSTAGYDELYNRVSGADFDRPLYQGFQNSQRGAAMQNQRMYAQMGNPALAAEATMMERRGAEGNLFNALGQNNLNRLGMLSNIEGARTGIQAQNVQARNAARMNALNFRAGMAQQAPGAQAISAIGGMAMGYGAQRSGQMFMQQQDQQNMAFFQSMFGRQTTPPASSFYTGPIAPRDPGMMYNSSFGFGGIPMSNINFG
jgi:hypothetical protein